MNSSGLLTEAEKSEMRRKNFEESRLDPNKNKYGLFSFAGTLAILPHSYDRKFKSRRNSDGGVITEPRNFMTSPPRKGKNNDALFSPTEFISIGEKYKDPPKFYLNEKVRSEKMRKSHDVVFKPGGPTDNQTIFEYISPEKPKQRKRRDSEGNILFEPKNFYTSPAKKGVPGVSPGTTFGEPFEHIPEPYDRPKELKRKERLDHLTKVPDRPFKPTGNHSNAFNKDEAVYNICDDIKKVVKRPKPVKAATHEMPFKPCGKMKAYLNDALFGEIPEYIPEPLISVGRKSPSSSVPWKVTYNDPTRPTPSISAMKTNIRSEFKIY